jgi:hypothetical protein
MEEYENCISIGKVRLFLERGNVTLHFNKNAFLRDAILNKTERVIYIIQT